VDQAVEDGVGQCRVADEAVPAVDRELADDHRRAAFVAVLEDFEQVAALFVVHGGKAEVIEDDEVEARELGEELAVTAVALGDGEFTEQSGQAQVADGVAIPTGLVGQRAGVAFWSLWVATLSASQDTSSWNRQRWP